MRFAVELVVYLAALVESAMGWPSMVSKPVTPSGNSDARRSSGVPGWPGNRAGREVRRRTRGWRNRRGYVLDSFRLVCVSVDMYVLPFLSLDYSFLFGYRGLVCMILYIWVCIYFEPYQRIMITATWMVLHTYAWGQQTGHPCPPQTCYCQTTRPGDL